MTKLKLIFKYVLYWLATNNDRHRYDVGKIKGYHCLGWEEGLTGRTYYYDRSRKPEREYLTFQEFKTVKDK